MKLSWITSLAIGLTLVLPAIGCGDGQPTLVPTPTAVALQTGIVFTSSRDGNFEIYVMNIDGSSQTRLTDDPSYDMHPAWSPDGTKIAFSRAPRLEGGPPFQGKAGIYVMNTNGSALTRLTNNPLAHDSYPAWSPDSTKIAFSSWRDVDSGIYVMNADGSDQTKLMDTRRSDYDPSWSPDGTKIAFQAYTDKGPAIYVVGADGSGRTRLTDGPSHSYDPAWSPDSTKIAFWSKRDYDGEIYVMNADGSDQIRLTRRDWRDWQPSWSPDGTKIAFSRSSRDRESEIYVMNADGSNRVNLTHNLVHDFQPSWGPGR